MLKKAGAEVTVTDNGRIAYEKAMESWNSDRPYDLIFMDIQMPELDGHAATRLLRESGYKNPIIALTAHAMTDDRQKCINAGCNDYTTKPIDRPKLIELAAKYLLGHKQSTAA